VAAYVLVDIKVEEPARYEEYKKLAAATIAAYGGQYIVRGGVTETLEGDWSPNRLVVLEFPTVARAKEWWASEEYKPARDMRYASATSQMIVVEGA
jgi:uncharacterized protein (DUF1330 family)